VSLSSLCFCFLLEGVKRIQYQYDGQALKEYSAPHHQVLFLRIPFRQIVNSSPKATDGRGRAQRDQWVVADECSHRFVVLLIIEKGFGRGRRD